MSFGTFKRSLNVFNALLYANITKKRIPVRVALQLTQYCNMRCKYCYVNFGAYKNVKDKTTAELFRLIDELYSYGTRWIWFLGGEPLIREDFGEIVEYAVKKGIFCDTNTNGVLINEKNIDAVKKLDAVCISIDGDEESNDYYRGKGSFKKAVEAIRLLRKNNVKVRIHATLTRRTYKTLDAMVKLSNELGTSFNYSEVLKNELDMDDDVLTKEEAREYYTKYLEYKKRGKPIIHSRLAIEHMLYWPKENGTIIYKNETPKYSKNSYAPCIYGDLTCFLDVDGRLYACNGTWGDGLNIYEVGFEKAWDRLANRKCVACKCIGVTEIHRLFRLYPRSILNALKQILKHNFK